MDFMTAKKGYEIVQPLLATGLSFDQLSEHNVSQVSMLGYEAYRTAPQVLGFPLVGDIPAVMINILATWVVYIGIRESKNVANAMVLLKILIVFLVIAVGAFYIQPKNLTPFAPNGLSGVLKGISGVFFAYIGFDAISTTAEECKNPKRDLPRAMFYALGICTVLYVLISLVLTGVVSYKNLNVGDPLAYVFGPEGANVPWVSAVVSGSAIVALFSVLLVFQLGQPRIWMVMGRDGLLPKKFAELHPRYKTPWFSTIITGVLVGLPCLFMNLTEVTDLTSIGTLFAFFIVSIGVLFIDEKKAKFKVPYINGRWFFPPVYLLLFYYIFTSRPELLSGGATLGDSVIFLVYLLFMTGLMFFAMVKQWSLIPLLGATCCSYLMTELGVVNWLRFGLWLAVGLVLYFSYGIKKSKLAKK
jgi:amino acid transporter